MVELAGEVGPEAPIFLLHTHPEDGGREAGIGERRRRVEGLGAKIWGRVPEG